MSVGDYVFDHESLLTQFFPSALETCKLEQHFFDLFMYFYDIDLSQIRHIFSPLLAILLRYEIANIVTLWSLSLFLLKPKEFLSFQLQLLDDFLFLTS